MVPPAVVCVSADSTEACPGCGLSLSGHTEQERAAATHADGRIRSTGLADWSGGSCEIVSGILGPRVLCE